MRHGFTLVELSIVLIVLGLITGGVVAGKHIIRAAEIRSIPTDVAKFRAAYRTFRDEYQFEPGDLPTATQYWGVRAGTGSNAACYTVPTATGTATCNGDGDGLAYTITGDATAAERFLLWQHLANAGLISGFYNGASASSTAAVWQADVNAPATQASGGIWDIYSRSVHLIGNANFYDSVQQGAYLGTLNDGANYPLNPEETWSIDKKMDDSIPSTGNMMSYKPNVSACTTTDVVATAQYNITNPAKICRFYFKL